MIKVIHNGRNQRKIHGNFMAACSGNHKIYTQLVTFRVVLDPELGWSWVDVCWLVLYNFTAYKHVKLAEVFSRLESSFSLHFLV